MHLEKAAFDWRILFAPSVLVRQYFHNSSQAIRLLVWLCGKWPALCIIKDEIDTTMVLLLKVKDTGNLIWAQLGVSQTRFLSCKTGGKELMSRKDEPTVSMNKEPSRADHSSYYHRMRFTVIDYAAWGASPDSKGC